MHKVALNYIVTLVFMQENTKIKGYCKKYENIIKYGEIIYKI